MELVNGCKCHDQLIGQAAPELSFRPRAAYAPWRGELRETCLSLTGLSRMPAPPSDAHFSVEKEEKKDGYRQICFTFESEAGSVVPCYLLIPDTGREKYPVVITLQGHSTGFHNSVGEIKYEQYDRDYQPRGQFAIQAVREGYIALAIEQRAMGCRAADNMPFRQLYVGERPNCYYESMTALLLGRTMVGERCYDVSRAIDQLAHFPECDTGKIAITGNSGGGTISYYAAAYDARIGLSMPSCAFCPYRESIARVYHCSCNYIPHALRYFDMQDIAALIAPRPLTIVSGILDDLFLISGVERGYRTVEGIYRKAGAPDNCRFVKVERGHWWNVDVIWPEMRRAMGQLGWL